MFLSTLHIEMILGTVQMWEGQFELHFKESFSFLERTAGITLHTLPFSI